LTEKVDAFKASIRWYQRAPLAELEAFADNLRDALASREELDVKLQKLMEELVERRSQQAQYRIAFQAAVAAGGKIDMDAPD
jgi:hypothetical protein